MNRLLYTILLYILSPVILCYFVYRGSRDSGYLKQPLERLGFLPKVLITQFLQNKQPLHIHCASVGETIAATPFIKKLCEQYPDRAIHITTTTPTGREEIKKLIASIFNLKTQRQRLSYSYLPIDWPGACIRFLKTVKPKVSIFMETELWPNLIHQLDKIGIPTLLANARLSNQSLEKYLKYPKLSFPMFESISCIAAQYNSDRENFSKLISNKDRLCVIGSVKFDIQISDQLRKEQQSLRKKWRGNRPCWIAASIHPKEFLPAVKAHKKLLEKFPDLLLIAVPRHPEKFDELKLLCEEESLSFVSSSENLNPTSAQSIVVGDSMGELMLMFAAADVAFMGGSLIERGGHNPIEPAACGLPVIIGKSTYNFSDVCNIMIDNHCLVKVENEEALTHALQGYLSDDDRRLEAKDHCKKLILENSGSASKLTNIIATLIKSN